MKSTVKITFLTATILASAPVYAQTQSGEEAAENPNVIIVTARKTSERLSDTPISVTAFSEKTIEDAGLEDVRDIADLTPGLQFNGDFGRNSERPVVRGIANLRPETAQPVSLFVDGVFVRTGVVSTILDNVERVEVLKGPQAALYGRSTYGGVINYITRKPGDELSIKGSATIAEHDSYELSAVVSAPFGDSGLSGQIGGRYSEFGGSYENLSTLTSDARDVGSEKTLALFGTLRYNPTDELDIYISGNYSKDKDGQFVGSLFDSTFNNSVAAGGSACPEVLISYYCGKAEQTSSVNIATSVDQGTDLTPVGLPAFFGPQLAQWDFRAGLDREIIRGTANLSYDISDNINLSVLGGYTSEDLRIVTNQSYSQTLISNPFGSFPAVWVTDDKTDRDYWSVEGRLSGSIDALSGINWLVGIFHYEEDALTVDRDLSEADLAFDGQREDVETSIFGSLQFEVTPELTLGVEGRYSWEDITAINTDGGDPLKASFNGFSPRFTVDYKPSSNSLIYASASKGSKAGGFNNVNPDDPDEAPFLVFDEENVWQYELGFKTTFGNGAVSLDIAAFRLDLSDQQLSQVVILNEGTPQQAQVTVVQNVGKSRVNGVEVDVGVYPTDNLSLRFTYALADTNVKEGTDAFQETVFGDPSFAGSDIPRVAENSGSATIQWEPKLFGDWTGLVRADAIFTGSRFAQIHNLQETGDTWRANARLGVRNDNFELTLFARNLFNDRTSANVFRYVDPGSFRFFRRAYTSFLPRERQFGLTAKFKY
jgi:outer membrane receptor protein involved in Fe transport